MRLLKPKKFEILTEEEQIKAEKNKFRSALFWLPKKIWKFSFGKIIKPDFRIQGNVTQTDITALSVGIMLIISVIVGKLTQPKLTISSETVNILLAKQNGVYVTYAFALTWLSFIFFLVLCWRYYHIRPVEALMIRRKRAK